MSQKLIELTTLAEAYQQHLPDLRLPDGHPDDRPVARWIDHTLLKPEATPAQIEQLCTEAREARFASVCVNTVFSGLARQRLEGSGVLTCVVVGFPLGAMLSQAKAAETRLAIEAGAQEIDMVLPVGLLRGRQYQAVSDDIAQVVEAAHAGGALVKVILETVLLDRYEKIMGCLLSQWAGADFVKTSTGFSTGGATLEDVDLMRRVVGPHTGVKAAGGVRSLSDALAFLRAGATRLGSSSGVKIVQEAAGTAPVNASRSDY
jgi:deoxyribose-phosphate aldolase